MRTANTRNRCLAIAVACLAPGVAWGGGGPENILLVVNDLSDDSKTIANHYIRWRNIPDSNVLHLSWRGSQQNCTVKRFRDDLLLPVLKEIDKRKLSSQIDYVVYSAGFPWRVDLKGDYPDENFPRQLRPVASLTGATYLWQYILQKSPAIVTPGVNWYVPQASERNLIACRGVAGVPSRACRLSYYWSPSGHRTKDKAQAQRYLMSTVLGVTAGRGNTVDEVLDYLQRSIQSDRTHPGGTFYFAENNDVRSKARDACYRGVIAALQREGARAQLVSGTAPVGAGDIMGLTVGTRVSDLATARSRVLPGAICEHLTSFGGDLREKASQMPLTEFLRQGAAGASGTVTEPQAIQAKFPLPSIHLHYRRGCSLGEAFFQSVASPYQLLVVGDPLCQPWAKPPRLQVEGVEPGDTVSGVMKFTTEVDGHGGGPPRPCEVFVDGRLVARFPAGQEINLNTAKLAEGSHEVRVVAASADAIEAKTRAVFELTVDNNPKASLDLEVTPKPVAELDDWVTLTATAPAGSFTEGAKVIFEHSGDELGRASIEPADPPSASLRVRAKTLGAGPIRLRARVDDGARAEPQWIVVRSPRVP